MDPKLRIQLLGDFCLTFDGTPVSDVNTPRLQSLFAYLLLHQDASQSRRFIAFNFWPESTEEQALANLRTLLYYLRRAIPEVDQFLQVDAKNLQWQSDAPFTLDVDDLNNTELKVSQVELSGNQLELTSALKHIMNLYRGDLLPSCYDDWILSERERLRQIFIGRLTQLVQLLERQHDYDSAVLYAQRLLQCDPMQEVTYRQIMRLYALNDNRAAALRIYHTCATSLQQELGVEPDLLTQKLYYQLLNAETLPEINLPSETKLSSSVPLIGREREWELLERTYTTTTVGEPKLVILSGEAGIGKTRLAEELIVWVQKQGMTAAVAQCYAAQGELPFAPVAAWLRALPIPQLEKTWLAEVSRLLPELQTDQPASLVTDGFSEPWQRQRLFEALARMALNKRPSLILLLDDMQWCDHDTLEWLHYLLRFQSLTKLCIIGTMRAENLMDNDALIIMLDALRRSNQLVEIEVNPLNEISTSSLAEHLADRKLSVKLTHQIYLESEGNPLFILELMHMGLFDYKTTSSDYMEKVTDTYLPLPPKARNLLEARLNQLSPSANDLANLAAVIGREFTFNLLMRASGYNENTLVCDLDELWRRRIIREQGVEAYNFSHDKIREVAYDTLSVSRRRLLHHRVAQALEVQFVDGDESVVAQVAAHYERSGRPELAIAYYQKAGEVAQRTFGFEESVIFFTKALDILKASTVSREQDQCELELLLALGVPLLLSHGHAAPEVESVYARAWELCRQAEISQQRFQVLVGLRRFRFVRGELRKAHDLGEEMIVEAKNLENPALLARAHMMHGETLYRMGAFPQAYDQCVTGYDIYKTLQYPPQLFEYGIDTGVCCLVFSAISLAYMGFIDQARMKAREAIILAGKLNHPFTQCMCFYFTASLHYFCRDVQEVHALTESALEIAEKYGFALPLAWGAGLKGWTSIQNGHHVEGIDHLQQCLAACRSIGSNIELINQLTNLCEAYTQSGDIPNAQQALEQAFTLMQASEEYCWDAELHRLRGVILLRQQDKAAAEAAFMQAVGIAQQQQAKMLELRASVCLARLWRHQNRKQEAKVLLQGIYNGFNEGFDSPDVREAERLLQTLV